MKLYSGIFLSLLLLLGISSCEKKDHLFEKLDGEATGVHFSNVLNKKSSLNILNYLYYYNGSGLAVGDYNGDGNIDIYFTANEAPDKLYLNKGNFKFQDVSIRSGIKNPDAWTTGITNVDINNDGLLDLYICKVSGVENIKAHNLLLINQGNDAEGIPVFKESSSEYGLDFSGFSTQAVFLDYDRDGDLDMYLLNHSTHPNLNYGRGSKRNTVDEKSGDRFYENIHGKFVDVSSATGIHQGVIGYGLGISVGDLNADDYPDIYVGNDFFENDYLYINQKNKTFLDLISTTPQNLGHTTHFSMGNDIADVNNDGLADIVSLDMLPEDLQTYKTSGLEYPFQTYANYLKKGFSPQYMQNTLHLNNGNLHFSETAFLSGIAASEWSWGALLADFDNDTNKDLFITNGIKGATNNMDFIKYISNEKIQKKISQGGNADFEDLIKDLPEKKVPNYIFQNNGDNTFSDKSREWLDSKASFSHGLAYADFDNDGDLDLVVNNMDDEAGIFKNNSEKLKKSNHYLDLNFVGDSLNLLGIGARVKVFLNDKFQVQEHYLSRGYLSSAAPGMHFGLGTHTSADSVEIVWPGGKIQRLYKIPADQKITLDIKNADLRGTNVIGEPVPILQKIDSVLAFRHVEQSTLEFNRDILIPFAYTNLSPRIAVADINNDGLDDLIAGGGKSQPASLWFQNKEGKFAKSHSPVFEKNAISEDTDEVFFDADGDGDQDLIIVSGGNEFRSGEALQPRFYRNNQGSFSLEEVVFKGISMNASRISIVDLENDGDMDICISANVVPQEYGKTPRQFLFKNDGNGNFTDITKDFAPGFLNVGMVQDIVWADLDKNGYKDAIIVGHWMPLKIFLNNGKNLHEAQTGLRKSNGWWNSVKVADFDKDGDLDIVAGNWGLNSRLSASEDQPVKLYLNDFDGNGSTDPVMTYYYQNTETAFSSKDELDKQMPFLKKKFPNYADYSKASFEDVFPADKIYKSTKKQVYELATCYFENTGKNYFVKHKLPFEAQVSTVFAIQNYDFNGDGFEDILLVGNNYEISTQLGRLDASHGTLLLNDKNGFFEVSSTKLPDISGPARDIKKIRIGNKDCFIISMNNNEPIVLRSNK
ncbi:hypothetical protein C7S20_16350 [Christiangramia fulva]|uniref:ASPIC/UnbV domain-containing protein n=1 Tax=Christiangramia fulva TaxID=2126553 RepID=A0A2R3Z8X1_9FLAO|nr:VCBS repeat-containing protein [Christiangramia fulva]AVR46710.1 hypothetical protein C7S20_16350 [Christiangramia fulva]